eukprot:SAG22_NODE_1479_length_4327_cov_1.368496_3_plen_87_part_00
MAAPPTAPPRPAQMWSTQHKDDGHTSSGPLAAAPASAALMNFHPGMGSGPAPMVMAAPLTFKDAQPHCSGEPQVKVLLAAGDDREH